MTEEFSASTLVQKSSVGCVQVEADVAVPPTMTVFVFKTRKLFNPNTGPWTFFQLHFHCVSDK